MVFRCGGSYFLNFLLVQKATLGRTRRKPKAPSGLHWRSLSVWRHHPFFGCRTATIWSQFQVASESNVRQEPPQAKGTFQPAVAFCFGGRHRPFFGGRATIFGPSFLSVQKATLGRSRRKPKTPSGHQWHAVLAWRPAFFGSPTATIWT